MVLLWVPILNTLRSIDSFVLRAVTPDWLLTVRRNLYRAQGPKTIFKDQLPSAVFRQLVNQNLGSASKTTDFIGTGEYQGTALGDNRMFNGFNRFIAPDGNISMLAHDSDSRETVSIETTLSDTVYETIRKISTIQGDKPVEYLFLSEWYKGRHRWRYAPRPLGVDRALWHTAKLNKGDYTPQELQLIQDEFIFISHNWDQSERIYERLDTTQGYTHVAIEEGGYSIDGGEDENPNTYRAWLNHNYANRQVEYAEIQSQPEVDSEGNPTGYSARDEALSILGNSQRNTFEAGVKLNLDRVVYGRDFGMGDRVLVESFNPDQPYIGDVDGVSATYSGEG